jgi:hypothetical protein
LIDPKRLVFIDETWTKTNMTRSHGWTERGQRLIDKVPYCHWQTTTFVAARRYDRIAAPCPFDGPINGERFLAYVNQELAPTLNKDDIVVADNLGSHKSRAVRRAIRDVGARLIFPPKYSPDSQSDRAQLLEAERGLEKGRGPQCRRRLRRHRRNPHNLHSARMRKLLRPCRICVKLKAERSSGGRGLVGFAPINSARQRTAVAPGSSACASSRCASRLRP